MWSEQTYSFLGLSTVARAELRVAGVAVENRSVFEVEIKAISGLEVSSGLG